MRRITSSMYTTPRPSDVALALSRAPLACDSRASMMSGNHGDSAALLLGQEVLRRRCQVLLEARAAPTIALLGTRDGEQEMGRSP
jgi:hypothetical protein